MIINQIIFGILCIEAIICIILVLPYGKRICQSCVQFLSATLGGPNSSFSYVGTVMLAIVCVLFLANVHTSWKYKQINEVLSDGMRIRLLMAQRDMYISGFTLFLFILLRLVYSSMETNIRLEKNLQAMEKQAKNASAGYKMMLEENDKIKFQLDKLKEFSEGGKEGILDKLLSENSDLTSSIKDLKLLVKDAESQKSVIKKQAESQQDAFMKLMDKNVELQKKIMDFDALKSQASSQMALFDKLMEENKSLKDQLKDFDFMYGDQKKKQL